VGKVVVEVDLADRRKSDPGSAEPFGVEWFRAVLRVALPSIRLVERPAATEGELLVELQRRTEALSMHESEWEPLHALAQGKALFVPGKELFTKLGQCPTYLTGLAPSFCLTEQWLLRL
jgi:hypothetical protein